jgi:hypothetical protein
LLPQGDNNKKVNAFGLCKDAGRHIVFKVANLLTRDPSCNLSSSTFTSLDGFRTGRVNLAVFMIQKCLNHSRVQAVNAFHYKEGFC